MITKQKFIDLLGKHCIGLIPVNEDWTNGVMNFMHGSTLIGYCLYFEHNSEVIKLTCTWEDKKLSFQNRQSIAHNWKDVDLYPGIEEAFWKDFENNKQFSWF